VGRHSSTNRWPYLRSVTAYALPWVVIAAIVGIAVWIAVGAVGGDPVSVGDTSSETSPSAEPSPSQSPTPAPAGTPADEVARKDDEDEKGSGDGRIATPEDDLVTEGIIVQVLNGTGGIEGAAEMMANRLARLGYEIYAINTGLTIDRTTVYWSTDPGREAAISLAAHFGWDVGAAPPSLSDQVDIAVVVGTDEAG
jgi:hypothetical protein